MAEGSLADELAATLQHLDALAEQHQEAEAYAATLERLVYLHDLLRQLDDELTSFKQETLDHGDTAPWHATCVELRMDEPATFRSPAKALISADVALLELITYISAALARIRERRARLASQRVVGAPPSEQS